MGRKETLFKYQVEMIIFERGQTDHVQMVQGYFNYCSWLAVTGSRLFIVPQATKWVLRLQILVCEMLQVVLVL